MLKMLTHTCIVLEICQEKNIPLSLIIESINDRMIYKWYRCFASIQQRSLVVCSRYFPRYPIKRGYIEQDKYLNAILGKLHLLDNADCIQ